MSTKYKTGFTLIELLVVIAIVGILSAVVLQSLGNAKNKSGDTTIKGDLTQAMREAEIYFGTNFESYGTFTQATCPTTTGGGTDVFRNDAVMVSILNHAVAAGGNSGSSCSSADLTFAIAVGMKTPGASWCVDSTGTVTQFAGTPAAAISSNACN